MSETRKLVEALDDQGPHSPGYMVPIGNGDPHNIGISIIELVRQCQFSMEDPDALDHMLSQIATQAQKLLNSSSENRSLDAY